jgi:DNA invertase Pin-like site-specific DNA recombinase
LAVHERIGAILAYVNDHVEEPALALLYARQSKDTEGTERAVGCQVEDGEELARRRGVKIVEKFIDNDRSASGKSKKGRPRFEALLEAIAAGKAKTIITWDLTRLTRNRRDTVRLIETCEAAQATIFLVRGGDLDLSTPAGRMLADVLAGIARGEIEVKDDRQKREALQAAQEGRWTGGPRPTGYDADGVTLRTLLCPSCPAPDGFTGDRECKACGALAINKPDSEADAIEKAYMAVLAGVSLSTIARRWDELGMKPRRAEKWNRVSVRHVLRNPRNMGLRTHNGQIMGRAEWAPIVAEETWRAVDDLLSERAAKKPLRSGTALLTGLARCQCGVTVRSGGNRLGERVIRCGDWKHFMRKAEPVEEYVNGVVVERLKRPDAADLLIDDDRPDIDTLRAERVVLKTRLDGIAAAVGSGAMLPSQVGIANAPILKRMAEIDSLMADAGRVDILGPLINADDVEKAWEALGVERKRRVIDVLLDIVVLPPGSGVRTFRPESVRITPKGRGALSVVK